MNSIHINHRSGISVIEVLTAIVVALIGAAGVMIMIPLAVQQAEVGFDQETAYREGINAANHFDINGFSDTSRWIVPIGSIPTKTARGYAIDPMWVSQLPAATTPPQAQYYFPFVSEGLKNSILASTNSSYVGANFPSADKCVLLERGNIGLAAAPGTPMSLGVSRYHFSWSNDLQTTAPSETEARNAFYSEAALAPPKQIYDQNASGTDVKRQALGEMSYMVVSSPTSISQYWPNAPSVGELQNYPATEDPDALTLPNPAVRNFADYVSEFRDHFLVYKRRLIGDPSARDQPYDLVYQVDPIQFNYPIADWGKRMAFAGGTLKLRDVAGGANGELTNNDLNASNSLSNLRPDGRFDSNGGYKMLEIRRGDWIALTNVTFNVGVNRFVQQINFYQVADAYFVDTTDDPADGPYWLVTLNGPDFDFGIEYQDATTQTAAVNQVYGNFREFSASFDPTTGQAIPSRTYAVHLPDVWAVFERTYRK
ncbi:MAG: hypothetical protein R3C03_15800 [Pirellulaceae bacterium]